MGINKKFLAAIVVVLFSLSAYVVYASTTSAGPVEQVFTLTDLSGVTYSNPTGAFQPMEILNFTLSHRSLLDITLSARGTVAPSGSAVIPIVFINCHIDGSQCPPSDVQFLYPQSCCDVRSYTWVVPVVGPGSHTVTILIGMGNPTSAVVNTVSLVVLAARV